MPVFDRFLGVSKALEPAALPDGMCSDSENQRPGRNDLRPWNVAGGDPKTTDMNTGVIPSTAPEQSIYRVRRSDGTGFIISHPTHADFVQGLDDLNAVQNVYVTGIGAPRFAAVAMAGQWDLSAPAVTGGLAVPDAPTVTLDTAGSGGPQVTIGLCYQWIGTAGTSPLSAVVGTTTGQQNGMKFKLGLKSPGPTAYGSTIGWRVFARITSPISGYFKVWDTGMVQGSPPAAGTTLFAGYEIEIPRLDLSDPFLSKNELSALQKLGMPKPAALLSATITEGTEPTAPEPIFLTYTIVVDGRESMPAEVYGPLIPATGDSTLNITLRAINTQFYAGASVQFGDRYTVKVYRTKAGYSTSAFFRVAQHEVNDAGAIAPDSVLTTLNIPIVSPTFDELATDGWLPPPTDGHHITMMWDGMAAMLSGSSIHICEPGVGYAWPGKYRIPLAFRPVSAAAWQQTLVVGTDGKPYAVQGSQPPLSYSMIELNQSCVSQKSMASVGHGVVWAGPSGLAYVGDKGAAVITTGLIPPEVWSRDYYPHTIVGSAIGSYYFASYFDGTTRKAFCIDTLNPAGGILPLSSGFRAAYTDHANELMFVLPQDNSNVQVFDAGSSPMTAGALSKVWLSASPQSFAAFEVVGTGTSMVKIIADGQTLVDRDCQPGRYYRLKDKAATKWQVEVKTSQNVQSLVLGRIDSFGNLVP